MIGNSVTELKCSHAFLKDVEKVHQHQIVLKDGPLTERDPIEALNNLWSSVSHISNRVLGFEKLCVQWEPHSIEMEQNNIPTFSSGKTSGAL